MKFAFLFVFISAWCTVFGQVIPADQVREDLQFLIENIEAYNPALPVYVPDFKQKSEALLAQVPDKDQSLSAFFAYVSRLCALSQEGHFTVGNWADTVHSGFADNRYHYLPMSFFLVQNRVYVWNDFSTERPLHRGAEILSINGSPTQAILDQLRAAWPTDGSCQNYADKSIMNGFTWMYHLFIAQPDTFALQMHTADQNERIVSIKALTRQQQLANFAVCCKPESRNPEKDEGFYQLTHADGVSYLTLPSFDYRKIDKYELKASKFYKSIFTEIEQVKSTHLVIDLRGNTGGRNDFADDLVPYIRKDKTEVPYLKKTVSWDGKEKVYKMPKRAKQAFAGKIYVLVDGKTYSAGSTLARYLFEFADATVIGEETGSRYEGFAAGSKQVVTLPHSKIEIGIPRYHITFPPSAKQTTTNRGLIPLFEIKPSVQDVLTERDVVLETAKALVQEDQRK